MKKTILMILLSVIPFLTNAQTIVTDDITVNTTWSGNVVLDGLIFVDSLVTLTIEPGTVIKGKLQSNILTGDGASALIIRRGAMLMAAGTPQNPIIFTSELDDVNNPNDLTKTDRGLWGGLIVLGRASTNQPTTENQVEGIPSELNAKFGGTDDNDNSGVIRFVSIRHGGFSISGVSGDEINGLTMGAIGSQTTIEYIEVFANFDDGYEWFGGTVNTKYLVAAFCGDDAFDYDMGFRGKGQFWFTIQNDDEAGRGGEHDGGDDNETGQPYAIPLVTNSTFIGSGMMATGVAGDGNDRALYFRDNAGGKYWSSIFTEYVGQGVTIEDLASGEDSRSRLESGDLLLENNYWWNFGAGNDLNGISSQDFVRTYLAGTANNYIQDPMLRGISRNQDGGLDPRVKLASPALSGGIQPADPFFDNVNYVGAFNPYTSLWTDGWTALYSMGFTGDQSAGTANQVVVTDDITSNTNWTANNEYLLNGLIFVDSLATLTIEPGTVIKGRLQSNITTGDGASALIVRRGGMLMAEGTKGSPIIFTTELDDLTNDNDLTKTDRGLWGGLIVLGRATTNQPTTENQVEGIPSELNAKFGGTDDNDNSGVLKYISIRHGGFSISGVSGDEINGLTMGALGSQTVIEHIEVFANFDDGYEWFGGTVNTRWLVAAFCGDDAFDYDMGFRGKGQFWFTIQNDDEAGRGGEHDGGDDNETGTPYAIPLVSNATYIGAGATATGVAGDGNDRCIYFRDNAGGKYWNSIFTDYVGNGVTIEDLASGEDSRSRLEAGELVLANNFWWDFGAGNDLNGISTQDFVRTYLAANSNFITDPQINNISRDVNGGFDPRPNAGGPAANGFIAPPDPWFYSVSYYGAFDPNDGLWTEGWTALSTYGFTATTVVGVEEEEDLTSVPSDYTLSQNYPNPFNPSTVIEFAIPQNTNVKLAVYNIVGEQVGLLINEFKNAGTYKVNWTAENLSSGVYFYRLEAGNRVLTHKMMLLK